MPFVEESGAPLDRVALLYRGGPWFQLTRGFAYIDPRDGTRWHVPAHDVRRPPTELHNGTDLASVPPYLWGLIASYGHQTLPAILHDRLTGMIPSDDPAGKRMRRRRVLDALFRVALRESGVPDLRSTAIWCAVRLQAFWTIRPPLGRLLAAQLILGIAACVAAIALAVLGHPLFLLLLLAPGALALPWGSELPFVVTTAYLSALYSPLLAGAAVASAAEYALAGLVWLISGRRGAPPTPGPMIARVRRTGAAAPDRMSENEGS